VRGGVSELALGGVAIAQEGGGVKERKAPNIGSATLNRIGLAGGRGFTTPLTGTTAPPRITPTHSYIYSSAKLIISTLSPTQPLVA
jgi:hypothetical protein